MVASPESAYRLTVFASHDLRRNAIGIGIVIREPTKDGRRGSVVTRLRESYRGCVPGDPTDFAVLRALEIAIGYGYSSVFIHSNSCRPRRRRRGGRRDRANDVDPLHARIAELSAQLTVQRGGLAKDGSLRVRRLARAARLAALAKASTPAARRDSHPLVMAPEHFHVEVELDQEDRIELLDGTEQDDDEELQEGAPGRDGESGWDPGPWDEIPF